MWQNSVYAAEIAVAVQVLARQSRGPWVMASALFATGVEGPLATSQSPRMSVLAAARIERKELVVLGLSALLETCRDQSPVWDIGTRCCLQS